MRSRQEQTTDTYFKLMHKHLQDVKEGNSKVLGLNDISKLMHIQPRHLSNTVKKVTGKSPCYFFERELINVSKDLLSNANLKIADIAFMLHYDPSNFTKFFKHYSGLTPTQFRQTLK